MKPGFLNRVVEIPEGITEDDLADVPYEERSREWLLKYIAALEHHCKEIMEGNHKLWSDNVELSKRCKEHFDKMQELLRYELKWGGGERILKGKVAGTNQEFAIPQGKQ